MSEIKHTPLPWRVEQDTDLIWGACNEENPKTYGMGYPIVSGFSSFGLWAKGKPDFTEKEANAELIVTAVNSYATLTARIEAVEAENERLNGLLIEALSSLDIYADPTGYYDQCGDQLGADAESYDGLLAKGTAESIRAALSATKNGGDA